MATYMRQMCCSCFSKFRISGQMQLQLWRKQQINLHHPITSLTLLNRRTICSSDAEEPRMSYPGEYEFEDGINKVYDGELLEGQERPHMLHAVWKIRGVKRRPWWEIDAMEALGLTHRGKVVIHKNTDAVNELLTQVRHLICIKPVILKYGLPNGDYENTLLKQSGEFVIKRKIQGPRVISEEDEEYSDKEKRTKVN